jgi:hypothetical protein
MCSGIVQASQSYAPHFEKKRDKSKTDNKQTNKQTNSMVRVRERTIPTERPPLVGEVIANFCG